jgi:uncharacterized protein (TIGR00255 family)
MTGYGSAKGQAGDLQISVEVKSVNNRYLDASVRMPRSFLFAEDAVKSAIGRHISRGKVDMFINVDSSAADDVNVKVNEALLKGYIDAIGLISEKYGLENDLTAVSAGRFPDILSVEKKDLDAEEISAGLVAVAEQALRDFDAMREREGEKLCADVLSKLETISSLVSTVEKESPRTVEAYQNRLREKISEVLSSAGVDENRILAEAAIYADRVAVDEETVRLRSHMSQLRSMLAGGSPIGRKIDFLIQEFNREANTIGSKCQNSDIAHVVVELKSEIEKIREQIQNIE